MLSLITKLFPDQPFTQYSEYKVLQPQSREIVATIIFLQLLSFNSKLKQSTFILTSQEVTRNLSDALRITKIYYTMKKRKFWSHHYDQHTKLALKGLNAAKNKSAQF